MPHGDYRYEIRRDGRVAAYEDLRLTPDRLTGVRRAAEGGDRHEVEAEIDSDLLVRRMVLRYLRGPFSRSAVYEGGDEFLRGALIAMGSRNDLVVKLGRFREVDGDLILFKALIIARARARGQTWFTGRVAILDPNTLIASAHKQTYRQREGSDSIWIYEPRMGDSETIELDHRGVIVRRRDNRGTETVLVSAPDAQPEG
ncbi:MAG: hypothetical protein IVW54_03390 [Candidatus Binataceae bacterium]|nr:hypothetical protein [Candidatus Binataceae bacterium]